MLDPLIVVDVVARKRCAVSLAFDIVKRMRLRVAGWQQMLYIPVRQRAGGRVQTVHLSSEM